MAIMCISEGCSCPRCNPEYWCIEGEMLMENNNRLREIAEDILANGYDQGRRIRLRAALDAAKAGKG